MPLANEKALLRWGIVGCGRISGDFLQALMFNCEEPNVICAVAASDSKEKAVSFRDQYQLPADQVKTYGTYKDLYADGDIDVVYIGVLNHLHKKAVLDALEAGKHVLCEKTLGVNAKEVREMVQKAKEKGLFLMEAYWSCLFPIWQIIKRDQLQVLGGAQAVLCDFGYTAISKYKMRTDMGGGQLLAIGCYAVLISQWVFGMRERPTKISARGGKDENGVDTWASIALEYEGGKVAHIFYSGEVKTPCTASISGPKGHFRLPNHFWCPILLDKELFMTEENIPSGKDVPKAKESVHRESITCPLPDHNPNATTVTYRHINTEGLSYEADHVYRCIKVNGALESDQVPMEASIVMAEIFDEIRKQLGVTFPQD